MKNVPASIPSFINISFPFHLLMFPFIKASHATKKVKGEDTSIYPGQILSWSLPNISEIENNQNQKSSSANQDNSIQFTIYAVFDGHGGEFASQYCIDNLKYVLDKYKMDDVVKDKEKMMFDLFKALDEELLEEADKKKSYAGTTALMMIVNGKQITIANAGDSRGILVHRSGSIMLLSQDHKPDRKDERSRITKLGGLIIHWGVWRVEGLLAVSRALFVFVVLFALLLQILMWWIIL